MNRNPVASPCLSLLDDRSKRRRKTTAQTGCGDKADLFRKPYQIDIREADFDLLRERAPLRKARLRVLIANLLVARNALWATPATATEGSGYPIARAPMPHLAADAPHDSGKFMSRHVGRLDIAIVPHPAMPVTTTDTARSDIDDRRIFVRDRR
jgi:hypothetical protein